MRIYLFFLLSFTIAAHGQQADSLRTLLTNNSLTDSSRAMTLSRLANEINLKEGIEAIQLADEGLALSKKIQYENGMLANLQALANAYQRHSSFDTSNFYFREARQVAIKTNSQTILTETDIGLAYNFLYLSLHDSSRFYLEEALTLAKKNHNLKKEVAVYINIGKILQEEGDYKKALEIYIDASRLYEKLNDPIGQGRTLANIGNIEYIMDNLDDALKYAQEGLAKSKTDIEISAYSQRLIGRIFRKNQQPDSALAHYEIALKLSQSSGNKQAVTELLQNIGNVLFDKGTYHEAIHYYKLSLKSARSISNKATMAYNYTALGNGYFVISQFAKAQVYTDSALAIAKELKNSYLVMDAYNLLSAIHEKRNDFKGALFFHQKFTSISDSISKVENHQAVEDARAKFELENKETQISLLKQDQELKTLALSQQRLETIWAVSVAIAILIIAALAINRYRVVSSTRRQLEIERMRNALARDLHDDIGSALSSISIMSQLEKKSAYSERIMEQSSRIQESMSDIVWSINPMNDSIEKVIIKMREFAAEILEPKNISYLIQEEGVLKGDLLNVEERKNIFLIFKEALNNTAKYSEAKNVSIKLSLIDHTFLLTIKDDGKGFDASSIKTGNGLRNMKARAEAIRGTISIRSVAGQGTTVSLEAIIKP